MPIKMMLDIEDELWEHFKKTIPRGVNLNEAVVELIRKRVHKYENRKTIPLNNFFSDDGKEKKK